MCLCLSCPCQGAAAETPQQRLQSFCNKLRQQGQQARWFALTLEKHKNKDDTQAIAEHGIKAEALFKDLKMLPAKEISDELLAPKSEELTQLFDDWDRLLPMARRMERDMKPAKPKGTKS